MEGKDELRAWCQKNQLSEDTYQVLRQEGFTSLQLLSFLTPEEVDKSFKQPRLLPLAQSLALQHAVASLRAGRDLPDQVVVTKEAREVTSSSTTPTLPGIPQRSNFIMGTKSTQQQWQQQQEHMKQQRREQQQQQHRSEEPSRIFGRSVDASAESMEATAAGSSWSAAEEVKDIVPEQHYRFLLVGKTGSGKSTTGNSILGAELFDEDVAFDSQTNRSQLKRGIVNGKCIEIMDSPGLFDTHRTQEEISLDIVKAVACMHPGPHAILYVIRLGRYTEEEYEVYTRLKALFDQHVTRYVIVIFTGGDTLEKEGKDIEEVLRKVPSSLHRVLQECQHRVVVFNNVADDTRPYVQRLMRQVEQLLCCNGGGFYTCPRYAEVGRGVEEEVSRRLLEMEREQLADKPFVQELKRQANSADEDLQEARRLFKQREQERQLEAEAAEKRALAEIEALGKEMENKNYTLEQQRAEREKLLEKHHREQEEWRKEMERQRERDRAELKEKEKEFEACARKAEQQQKKFLEAKQRIYEQKIAQMKDSIAKDEEPGFLDNVLGRVKGALEFITSFIPAASALFQGSKK